MYGLTPADIDEMTNAEVAVYERDLAERIRQQNS